MAPLFFRKILYWQARGRGSFPRLFPGPLDFASDNLQGVVVEGASLNRDGGSCFLIEENHVVTALALQRVAILYQFLNGNLSWIHPLTSQHLYYIKNYAICQDVI